MIGVIKTMMKKLKKDRAGLETGGTGKSFGIVNNPVRLKTMDGNVVVQGVWYEVLYRQRRKTEKA